MSDIIKRAFKKSTLFKIGIAAAMALSVMIVLRMYLSFAVPERMLKDSLISFFMENFGKAVKFEEVGISLTGDIGITNLNMSISSDFNDNISLIQCPSVTIGLDLWSLLRGGIRMMGIRFAEPRLMLLKRYDRTYEETIRELFMPRKGLDEMGDMDIRDFTLILSGARVTAVEYLVDGRMVVESTRVKLEVRFDGTEIEYRIKGTLVPFGSSEISEGSFAAKGTIYTTKKGHGYSSIHRLNIDNFDVSHLNQKLLSPPLMVFGGVSISATVYTTGGHVSVEGVAALNNLNLVERGRSGARSVIANENMNVSFAADVIERGRRIAVRELEIGDDSMRLIAKAVYSKNPGEEYFDVQLERCRIDLARLSDWLTLWEGVSMDGLVEGAGRVLYDMRHNRAMDVTLSLGLDELSVTGKTGGVKKVLLSMPRARVVVKDGAFSINAEVRKERSELVAGGAGYIRSWFPPVSESTVVFDSKAIEARYPARAALHCLRRLYAEAREDKTRGYEQIFFTKTPLGAFVNNNTIDCTINVQSVLFGGRKALRDLNAAFRLADGYLRLERFSLGGLGGDYGLDLRAYLKSDYPGGSVSGHAKGINLEELAGSLGMRGAMSGTLGADFKFEFSGNRKAHLIDNGKLEFNLTAESGLIHETAFQKRLAEYLVAAGYDKPAISRAGFTRVILSGNQVGENLYLGNISFSGDSLNAAGYGTYRPDEGLRIPINASFAAGEGDEAPGKTTSVPLLITGRLFDPVLKVSKKKDSDGLPLFHVD